MKRKPFDVWPFSRNHLFSALSNTRIRPEEVQVLRPSEYLAGYLDELGVKTMLAEYNYIDGDFLDDFASYYVRCFQPYDRFCTRLHFFNQPFTRERMTAILGGLDKGGVAELQSAYRGFVVVRPLPQAVIGRTVLHQYTDDHGRRNFLATRRYDVHLFGIDLAIRGLVFQEQDTVIAACATVALWSAFDKTHELFGTPRPRPAEITRAANLVRGPTRAMPSHELRIEQMGEAIRALGLEPEYIEVTPTTPLASIVYAHLKMELPVVLGVRVGGPSGPGHAITITGYSMLDSPAKNGERAQARIVPIARRIDRFYAHDDALGPFARLSIESPRGAAHKAPLVFGSGWRDRNGQPVVLVPEVVIVPVYPKIRVTYTDMISWLRRFAEFLDIFSASLGLRGKDLEWDLHLATSNVFKVDLRKVTQDDSDARRLLMQPLPRFIWRAKLRIERKAALEFVGDATDLERNFPIIHVYWIDKTLRSDVRLALSDAAIRAALVPLLTSRFANLLRRGI